MCRGSEANPELIRLARVRQLFHARPFEERTENDVLPFYACLQKHFPELLPTGSGDPCQQLKADLEGLYK
jgi:hypothetical protein